MASRSSRLLFEGMYRGNRRCWGEWAVKVGAPRKVEHDPGAPAVEHRIWLKAPSGEVQLLSGVSAATAREIYRRMNGTPFFGDDGLREPLHLLNFENTCGRISLPAYLQSVIRGAFPSPGGAAAAVAATQRLRTGGWGGPRGLVTE
jgi:hypothetical protein